MNRRQWLRSLAALAPISLLTFRQEKKVDLHSIREHAEKESRPLLLVVVPEAEEPRKKLGALLGKYLNDASSVDLALLAIADVACAPRAQVIALEPAIAALGNPSLVMLFPRAVSEASSEGTRIPHLALDLETNLFAQMFDFEPEIPSPLKLEFEKPRPFHLAISRFLREHLRRAIPSLAEHQKKTVRSTWLRALEVDGFDPRALEVDRLEAVSAILLERLPTLPQRDVGRTRSALANVVRQRLVSKPPRGAVWFRQYGCNFVEEGKEDETVGVLCGTGFSDPPTHRFLDFLTGA